MKKILSLALSFSIVFGLLATVLAVSENAANAPGQNKVTTSEEDEDSGDETDEETEKKVKGAKPNYNPRSENAREHMSEVAKAVEELVRFSDRTEDPGIGEQVREIAQAQGDAEDEANEAIDEAQGRGAILKFFFGPKYGALKEAKKVMQENENRIRELNKIMNQLQNEGEQLELQEQIRVLEEQNIELSDMLEEETSGFSLLGWLFKWIDKY